MAERVVDLDQSIKLQIAATHLSRERGRIVSTDNDDNDVECHAGEPTDWTDHDDDDVSI